MSELRLAFLTRPEDIEPWYSDLSAALPAGCALVQFAPDEPVAGQLDGVRVVVDNGGHGTATVIDAAAEAGVGLWLAMTTGLDQLDVGRIRQHGIRIANTPGQFSATALAEHALLLMLCLARELQAATLYLRRGVLHRPLGRELAGATLGLIGFGQSGRGLGQRATALGMRVRAIDPVVPSLDEQRQLGIDWLGGTQKLSQLLVESDFVSLHVPLNAQTRQLIGAKELATMRESACLINVARGELVDEAALIEALETGSIAGAGIDVYASEPPDPQHPLLQLGNVVATPHIAGMTRGTSRRRAAACAENVRRFIAREPLLHEVTT
jgi:phosphoglycerate dehydrogenase-like enzyme